MAAPLGLHVRKCHHKGPRCRQLQGGLYPRRAAAGAMGAIRPAKDPRWRRAGLRGQGGGCLFAGFSRKIAPGAAGALASACVWQQVAIEVPGAGGIKSDDARERGAAQGLEVRLPRHGLNLIRESPRALGPGWVRIGVYLDRGRPSGMKGWGLDVV